MRSRQLNYLRHDMSARQALSILIQCWVESKRLPIVLIAPEGKAKAYASTIRVALAKEKSKVSDRSRVSYGFYLSDVFPYTDEGIRGEAVLIRWKIQRSHIFDRALSRLPNIQEIRK